ncbi:GtrA family protein [Nocardioides sp. CN2-186]|uniref:GtrA family protein n=1 Tax=Nocardioides tweenelious TaxID=3156607 RepID=UPI0032B44E27
MRPSGESAHASVLRFAAVGVANTTVDVGLFWLLHAPLGITVANVVSTSAGMAFSFMANGAFVFDGARMGWRQAMRFATTTCATMWILQPVLIHVLLFVGSATGAKLAATAVTAVVNFLVYRFFVWRTPQTGRADVLDRAESC